MPVVSLQDWVAHSPDQYVDLAVRHASDLGALQALRQDLRRRMLASRLCDAPRFVAQLEATYADMWAAHVRRVRRSGCEHTSAGNVIEVEEEEEGAGSGGDIITTHPSTAAVTATKEVVGVSEAEHGSVQSATVTSVTAAGHVAGLPEGAAAPGLLYMRCPRQRVALGGGGGSETHTAIKTAQGGSGAARCSGAQMVSEQDEAAMLDTMDMASPHYVSNAEAQAPCGTQLAAAGQQRVAGDSNESGPVERPHLSQGCEREGDTSQRWLSRSLSSGAAPGVRAAASMPAASQAAAKKLQLTGGGAVVAMMMQPPAADTATLTAAFGSAAASGGVRGSGCSTVSTSTVPHPQPHHRGLTPSLSASHALQGMAAADVVAAPAGAATAAAFTLARPPMPSRDAASSGGVGGGGGNKPSRPHHSLTVVPPTGGGMCAETSGGSPEAGSGSGGGCSGGGSGGRRGRRSAGILVPVAMVASRPQSPGTPGLLDAATGSPSPPSAASPQRA
jgi:hypothetical protein